MNVYSHPAGAADLLLRMLIRQQCPKLGPSQEKQHSLIVTINMKISYKTTGHQEAEIWYTRLTSLIILRHTVTGLRAIIYQYMTTVAALTPLL